MIVPSQANVPSFKIGEFAARNPKQQFYVPATEPLPNGSESHGGLHYDAGDTFVNCVADRKISSSVCFTRRVVDREKLMARIESITRSQKSDRDLFGNLKPNARKKRIAKDTKEIMFSLIWGNKLLQKRDEETALREKHDTARLTQPTLSFKAKSERLTPRR